MASMVHIKKGTAIALATFVVGLGAFTVTKNFGGLPNISVDTGLIADLLFAIVAAFEFGVIALFRGKLMFESIMAGTAILLVFLPTALQFFGLQADFLNPFKGTAEIFLIIMAVVGVMLKQKGE